MLINLFNLNKMILFLKTSRLNKKNNNNCFYLFGIFAFVQKCKNDKKNV